MVNKKLKFIPTHLILSLLILVVVTVSISYCIAQSQRRIASQDSSLWTIQYFQTGDMASLSSLFTGAVLSGHIKPEEYEKLSFAMPGDSEYGSNPEYELFNPKSPRSIVYDKKFEFHQKTIDSFTTIKNTRVLFNLRRTIQENGSINEALVAIVPNVDPLACEKLSPQLPLPLESTLQIAPNNHQVVSDNFNIEGCVETVDHQVYLFAGIFHRSKRQEGDTWSIH